MKPSPIASICIPVFNGARFLPRAIESICRQDFEDYEVLVSDDGSTDGSLELLHRQTNLDPRWKIVSNPSPGMVRNWKYVVEKACGRYFCMLMQDDFLESNFLSRYVSLAEKHNLDVASGLAVIRDENYRPAEIYFPSRFMSYIPTLNEIDFGVVQFNGTDFLQALLKDFENGVVKFHTSFSLIRMSSYRASGGIDAQFKYCADGAMFVSLAMLENTRFGFDYYSIRSNLLGFGVHRVSSKANITVRMHDNYRLIEQIDKRKNSYSQLVFEARSCLRSSLVFSHWPIVEVTAILFKNLGTLSFISAFATTILWRCYQKQRVFLTKLHRRSLK